MINVSIDNYRQVFRHRSFRDFWLGFTLSAVGDMMTRVALTWYVWENTHSAEALGLLTFFYTGPIILGGLLAGWLLDRFETRKVMIVDNLLRGAIIAVIPVMHALGQLQLWHIYVVAAVYGFLMMISLAGGPTLIPALVSKEHLSTANALEMLSFTLGGAIAPPLAGLLISQIGAPNVVIIDALSYFAFAFALSRVRSNIESVEEEESPKLRVEETTYRLRDAFQLLLNNKVLLSTTLMFMAANIGAGMMMVWLPILSDQFLGGGSELYGTLLGILALGEIVGSVAAGSLVLSQPLGNLISLSQFIAGASLGLLFGAPGVWTAAISLALFGVFSAPLTIWAQTLRMKIIPAAMRGRTFALLRMLMQSASPVGGVSAGLLLPLLGAQAMVGLSIVLVGVPGLIGNRVRELRLAH